MAHPPMAVLGKLAQQWTITDCFVVVLGSTALGVAALGVVFGSRRIPTMRYSVFVLPVLLFCRGLLNPLPSFPFSLYVFFLYTSPFAFGVGVSLAQRIKIFFKNRRVSKVGNLYLLKRDTQRSHSFL
jgi:hypothetical protein